MSATIELVLINLDAVPQQALITHATSAEREAAARRRKPLDARRFLARRVAMRSNLARILRRPPDAVPLTKDRLGRPIVADSDLHISQSSRGGVMLAAFCADRPVGCDLEEMRDDLDIDAVAALCFGPTERRLLRAAGPAARLRAFYDCWTRKEAYLKATGTGMAVDMAAFETTRRPGPPTRWGRVDWTSQTWRPLPGYAAAVVARGTDWRLQHRSDATALCAGFAA
ncbi:4'-phosphopantetheinyl transferase family protein [Sphingomonas desiccabilis]|uniref:4'-phosphopantetheinyl transferase superfamily protein n=1 Tax=Sphingomonas desiccabilis TaxID=429134 RepID=A0A4Q2ISE4_9SPHN|nr:4'-phosphopantetheinyl transferase superfamily protein [Sphingomonas desiccabilis]MBB3911830.1 4'-phosphopantetheinyl transferase [Sphingomonas desiccabilis]RXZ31455.1 4'-phosphopantetheinyl transferase superfamily protein [Sphingomonas desiccabilis]